MTPRIALLSHVVLRRPVYVCLWVRTCVRPRARKSHVILCHYRPLSLSLSLCVCVCVCVCVRVSSSLSTSPQTKTLRQKQRDSRVQPWLWSLHRSPSRQSTVLLPLPGSARRHTLNRTAKAEPAPTQTSILSMRLETFGQNISPNQGQFDPVSLHA